MVAEPRPAPRRRITIPCGHPGCALPAGYIIIQDGHLTVEIMSRHHGSWHRARIRVDEVLEHASTPEETGTLTEHHPLG
jgi:hypothetical protein